MTAAAAEALYRASVGLHLGGAEGMVGRAERLRLTHTLMTTGETDLLDYHLGAMQAIGAPPLLTGNSVDLLIDGPSTYREMFTAIEHAHDFVFVESFIFENA